MIDPAITETERRIVTTCAYDPECIDLVDAGELDFAIPVWRSAMQRLRELRSGSEPIDPLILCEQVPGLLFQDLSLEDVSPGLIPRYSQIVTEAACKRRLALGLSRVLQGVKDGTTANEALSAACLAISEATIGEADRALTVGQVVEGRYAQLAEVADAKARGEAAATGIPTGMGALDKHLGGLQLGIVTLLAARPAMGKSTVALNFSEHASSLGIGVHVFSLEDTRDAYADRVISYHSGVSTKDIRQCVFSKGQLADVGRAGEKMRNRKHWLIDDRSGIGAEEIVRCVRRHRDRNKTQLVIVDYLQLLQSEKGQSKREMLDHAINILGDAAKQDRMSYVCLSQLNRGVESREDKRPLLSDLKECGTLEERAKAVVFVYRDAEYNDRANPRDMEFLIRKNSNGFTGVVKAKWQPERMRVI